MRNRFLNLLLFVLLVLGSVVYASNETGPANTVLRIPGAGGRAKFGAVDLSQSAAVTGTLPVARGGTGVTTSTGTGSVVLSTSPTFSTSIKTPIVDTASGNLSLKSAGTTGITVDTSGNAVVTGSVTSGGNLKSEYSSAGGNVSVIAKNTSSTANGSAQLIATNDASRSLRLQYASSGTTGSFMTSGLAGESANIFTDGAYPLVLGTNAIARVNIDSSGNVGIKGALGLPFSVGDANASSATVAFRTTKSDFQIQPSNTAAGGTTIAYSWVSGGQGPLIFSDSTGERMQIDSSGNLRVGNTSQFQSALVSVYGSVAARNSGVDGSFANAFIAGYSANANEHNVIQSTVSSTATSSGFRFKASDGGGASTTTTVLDLTKGETIFYTGGTERARINSSGNLKVGVSNNIIGSDGTADATAGNVGEYVNSFIGAPVGVAASGSYANIASISLSAGDWDIYGSCTMGTGGTTVATLIICGISSVSASLSATADNTSILAMSNLPQSASQKMNVGPMRARISSTTTYYLVGRLDYSTLGTASWGTPAGIWARRVR